MTGDPTIEFFVAGPAVGKGRPRVGRTFGGHVSLRTPEKTVSYENLVGFTAAQAMAGRPLLECAVMVELVIDCGVPASWSRPKQQRALSGVVHPTVKPDVDNVEKAIFDALNGVVWKDDVQVIGVIKAKKYADVPGVRVRVWVAD